LGTSLLYLNPDPSREEGEKRTGEISGLRRGSSFKLVESNVTDTEGFEVSAWPVKKKTRGKDGGGGLKREDTRSS